MAFEFLCERLVPGCTGRVEGEDREAVMAGVEAHFRDQHDRKLDAELKLEVEAAIMLLPH